jgi:membrane-associated protease RseP (regulator of RpoE activity)
MPSDHSTYEFVQVNDSNAVPEFGIRKPPSPNYMLHAGLFILTFLSTTVAGVTMSGIPAGSSLLSLFAPQNFVKGLLFSVPLMLILLTHEMGHYFMSLYHRVRATLPYFIPAPTIIGTFGAFIKMKSPIYNKRALLDIGAAGPLAGFVVSIPAVILGLHLSEIVPATGRHGLQLGSSIIVEILAFFFAKTPPAGFDILIHPIGFAGWIGLFVTSLNLIPIGQLDGGHVAYALFDEKCTRVSRLILLALVGMGIVFWSGWLFWALIIYFLGTTHPPAIHPYIELDKPRKILAISVLIIFILTFIPTPFSLNM